MNTQSVILTIFGVFVALALVAGGMAGCPVYNVWQQGLEGEARLKRASQEKQILIQQAGAEKEAAQHRADAIEIVGAMAQKYPEYRMQEFMGAFADALQQGNIAQIVYVPTEAQLPILEATRIQK